METNEQQVGLEKDYYAVLCFAPRVLNPYFIEAPDGSGDPKVLRTEEEAQRIRNHYQREHTDRFFQVVRVQTQCTHPKRMGYPGRYTCPDCHERME